MRAAPRISIVIPVWREQANIGPLVRHLRGIDRLGECEIVVVDGDPAGSTLCVIDDCDVVRLTSAKGRAPQMNAGAAVARGEVLLFLHADTRLPESAIDDIASALAKRGAVGGAFRLRFDSQRLVYRTMSWFVNLARVRRLPFGDQGVFVTRRFFEEVGGYADIPVMEDVEFVRRVRRNGGSLGICPSHVRTSCRRMESEGVVRRVCKNTTMMALYSIGVSPRVLSRWYTDDHRRGPAETGRAAVGFAPPPEGP